MTELKKKKGRGRDRRLADKQAISGTSGTTSSQNVRRRTDSPAKDRDDAEKSTDRGMWEDTLSGKFDPKNVSDREKQLMNMSKRQLVQIILKFEQKHGRKHLALMLLGDDSDDSDSDSFEQYGRAGGVRSGGGGGGGGGRRPSSSARHSPGRRLSGRRPSSSHQSKFSDSQEELRVRNLDTGDVHGENSIDEQMADPRMVTATKTIRDLDSGRTTLVPVGGGSGSGVSSRRASRLAQQQQQQQQQQAASDTQWKLAGGGGHAGRSGSFYGPPQQGHPPTRSPRRPNVVDVSGADIKKSGGVGSWFRRKFRSNKK